MYAPSPRSAAARRNKPYQRKQQAMSRSGSILGTIKNIVSAPLSWFVSNEENFEDLGKRSRATTRDASDSEEDESRQKGKRIRVDSPERLPERVQPHSTGYLDPPPFASQPTMSREVRPKDDRNIYNRLRSISKPTSPTNSLTRNMSIDPPSHYTSQHRDPASVPLPAVSSLLDTSPRRSAEPREGSQPPRAPLRLRKSLTPQPTSARLLRRESSAPPISSLQSQPMFVRPLIGENSSRKLTSQKTVSLGTLADMNRGSRAPSRDRTLMGFGSLSSIPSQISTSISSDALLQPSQLMNPARSSSERAFQELEVYKTPIVPSRYKDAGAIPAFLQPKRVHVPIPLTKKGRESKPSLGMPVKSKAGREKDGRSTRDHGKPYARSSNIGKLLARCKAEEEEEERKGAKSGLDTVTEEDEMDTEVEVNSRKRNVAVSARTSGSEDDRPRKAAADPPVKVVDVDVAPVASRNDPFLRQPAAATGGRQQPYGRVGRTRMRDPGQRSVPLGRPTNRFAATFDDDDDTPGGDEQSMNLDETDSNDQKTPVIEELLKTPAFEAPKGFSFASNASNIEHDHSAAKEPPLPSLPFSFTPKPSAPIAPGTSAPAEPSPFKPVVSAFPIAQPPQEQPAKKDAPALIIPVTTAPQVEVVLETPEETSKGEKGAPVRPSFFAAPPAAPAVSATSTPCTTPKPAGIPNFFASSPLLTEKKPVASRTPPPSLFALKPGVLSSTPATPVKDPDNPLWNGNIAEPSAPPKLFASAAKPFTFGTKPAEANSAPTPSLFGAAPKAAESAAPVAPTPPPAASSSLFSHPPPVAAATPKSADTENKPTAPTSAPTFSFGAGTSSSIPKPLFGTGAAASTSSPFSMPSLQPAQKPSENTASKSPFMFGAPSASSTANSSATIQPSQPAQNTTNDSGRQSPFTFGAPPMASAASNNSATGGNDGLAAPKPLFGTSSGSTPFSFGAPAGPATPSAESAKNASPFAFGAPPATPPAGGERAHSPFTFGTPVPSSSGSTGFSFSTPAKTNGTGTAPSTPTNGSPFTFGAQPQRPVTPPSKPDEGMSMEESPTHPVIENKPTGSITFGAGPTPVNPFGQNTSSGSPFTFGAPSGGVTSNPFGPKVENKAPEPSSGFTFNRTSSAPTISTSFSFGAKTETPPATAFGASSNPFSQPPGSSNGASPFSFGQQQSTTMANPFGAPTQPTQPSATSMSPFTSTPSFTFGAPAAAPSNPFTFGSTPSSPAAGSTGLPQTPGSTGGGPAFTFGQSGASGSTAFNIGAAPPTTPNGGRQVKKLPRRAPAKR